MKWSGLVGADGILGGDLVDLRTPFAGRDKVVHVVLGAIAFRLAVRWLALGGWSGLGVVLALALLNELVEDLRYRRHGHSRMMSDEADGTDVLVTVAGGVLAWLAL